MRFADAEAYQYVRSRASRDHPVITPLPFFSIFSPSIVQSLAIRDNPMFLPPSPSPISRTRYLMVIF